MKDPEAINRFLANASLEDVKATTEAITQTEKAGKKAHSVDGTKLTHLVQMKLNQQ